MPRNYIPSTDAGLLAWSAHFDSLIQADPSAYGLTPAAVVVYAAKQGTYATALEAATNPTTRGGSTVFAKDQARKELITYTRQVVRTIQGTPTVTDQQKYDLGITIRDNEHTPIPPPSESPNIDIVSVTGRTVKVRLHDGTATRRGKPQGVNGATVLSYVGDEPPAEVADWKFEGNTSRTTFDVEFPVSVPAGAKVWLTAFWFNPRKQSGPACTPISTYVQYGGLSQAA